MLRIVFSIDICTHHRMSSKNIDNNICAHTWHSVSVMGHKQGFELNIPVFELFTVFTTKHDGLYIRKLKTLSNLLKV